MLLFIEGRWYCYKRCYKHPKTRNLCWSHSSFANSMRWVRLSEKFLFLPPPPLFSPDTEQGAHSSKSRSPRWGRQGGGRGAEGGRRKHLENRTWQPLPPNNTLFPSFPPSLSPLLFSLFSLFSLLFILSVMLTLSLPFGFLFYFCFLLPLPLLLYIFIEAISYTWAVLAMIKDSNDSPVRDCKTTHSSLNHQPLNPQTYDQDLIPRVIMALKRWNYKRNKLE